MKRNDLLRELANLTKYQILLQARKDICSVNILDNNRDFSKIQISFINWLQFYQFLRQEVSMDEVSDIVLIDDVYADAYYFWRRKKYREWLEKNYNKKRKEPSVHALNISHSRGHR